MTELKPLSALIWPVLFSVPFVVTYSALKKQHKKLFLAGIGIGTTLLAAEPTFKAGVVIYLGLFAMFLKTMFWNDIKGLIDHLRED